MDVLNFICLLGCMFALVAVLGNQRKIMEALADMQRPQPRGKCGCDDKSPAATFIYAEPMQPAESIIVAEDDE